MVVFERMRYLKSKIPGEQMDRLRAMAKATKVSPGQLDGMPHGSGVGNPVLEGVILIEDVIEAYRDAIEELRTMQDELLGYLVLLSDLDQKAFLKLFYVDLYTIPAIAEMMAASGRTVSARRVQQIIHEGEDSLTVIMPDTVKKECRVA